MSPDKVGLGLMNSYIISYKSSWMSNASKMRWIIWLMKSMAAMSPRSWLRFDEKHEARVLGNIITRVWDLSRAQSFSRIHGFKYAPIGMIKKQITFGRGFDDTRGMYQWRLCIWQHVHAHVVTQPYHMEAACYLVLALSCLAQDTLDTF